MKIKGAFAVRWAAQDGNGIKSITEHYLATSAGSGVTTSTSGWTTAVQATTATNKYLWNYEVILYTNGGTVTTSPHIIGTHGETGATGNGIKSITEYYQVSSSNTTAPTSWATTPPVMTSTNKYLWNYEVVTYTDGTTASTAKRVIGTYGDKGDTGAQGRDGITWRTSEWLSGTEYHNDTASGSDPRYVDIVVFPDEGRTEISAAYQCRQTHTASDASKPGSGASWQTYWQKVSNMQGGLVTPFIISEAAFIKNLTVGGIVSYDSAGNIVFKAKDGEVACDSGTFKNITVTGTDTVINGGTIGGWRIESSRLSNLDSDTYTTQLSPSSIRFIDEDKAKTAEIGACSVMGWEYLARFQDSTHRYGGYGTAMSVGLPETRYGAAIAMNGGYISGLCLKTRIASSSVTLSREDVFVLCTNTSSEITITLPSMQVCDEGKVIIIRRLSDGYKVNVALGRCEYVTTSGISSVLNTNGYTSFTPPTSASPTTDNQTLKSVGDGFLLTYTLAFDSITLDNHTRHGRWIVNRMVRDW